MSSTFIFNVYCPGSSVLSGSSFSIVICVADPFNCAISSLYASTFSLEPFFVISYSTDPDAASARIVYNSATGALFYDKDGAGSASDVKIATLSPGLLFTADNFLIV